MQSKKEIKQDEENRKIASFCRYLRKNPNIFGEHNLHQLMLDDQDKKGKPVDSSEKIGNIEKIEEKPEEPIEIVIDKPEEKEEKKEENLLPGSDKPEEPKVEEPKLEENKSDKKIKEKKPRKPRSKKEKAPEPPEPNLKDLPENPPLLERQSGVKEEKKLEPGPVDDMKSSGN